MGFFLLLPLAKRTSELPPFSSMNSTPAHLSTVSIVARDASSPKYFTVSMLVVVFRWRLVARLRRPDHYVGEGEAALLRLRREKRGEAEPEDFSGHLALGKCPLFVCRVLVGSAPSFRPSLLLLPLTQAHTGAPPFLVDEIDVGGQRDCVQMSAGTAADDQGISCAMLAWAARHPPFGVVDGQDAGGTAAEAAAATDGVRLPNADTSQH